MLNLHEEDHPWIAWIAPGRIIAFGQRLIEGASRVLFNVLHHPAKLGIGIRIIHIGDRHCDARVVPNIPVFLAVGGMRELEILSIPHKPHGRRLGRSIGSNGRHVGKLLEFRIFWTFGLLTSAMASLLAPFCSLLALPGTAFSSLHSLCIAMSSLAQTRPGGPISVVSQSAMETKLIILHSGALKKLRFSFYGRSPLASAGLLPAPVQPHPTNSPTYSVCHLFHRKH